MLKNARMKNFLLLTSILFTVLLFTGCKKDPVNRYYFTLQIDGRKFNFSDSLSAYKQAGQPVLVLNAYSKTEGHFQGLFSDYITGSYITSDDGTINKRIFQFTINAVMMYNNNVPVYQTFLRPAPSVQNPVAMTITGENSEFVEGNFQGMVSNGSSLSGIYEGSFRIPFR
jgi:hypothetical protein